MTLRIPRLDKSIPIAEGDGSPTLAFIRWWQGVAEAIEGQEAEQDAIIARLRRVPSHTVPTTILSATEDGVDVTIEVLDHTRVYGDATTLAITGNATDGAGLLPETLYGCYYDDTTLEDTAPGFVFTTDLPEAQATAAPGRHWCGAILTPALASGTTIESGGAYPVGSSIGGELY